MPAARPTVYNQSAMLDQMSYLITIIEQLKAAVNSLRTDFQTHDHGNTYSNTTIRNGAFTITNSGTPWATSIVSGPTPTWVGNI